MTTIAHDFKVHNHGDRKAKQTIGATLLGMAFFIVCVVSSSFLFALDGADMSRQARPNSGGQ